VSAIEDDPPHDDPPPDLHLVDDPGFDPWADNPPQPDDEEPPATSTVAPTVEAEGDRKAGPSQATRAIALAEKRYHLGVATSGETFAVVKGGPNIARPMRGSRSLRVEMANAYHEKYRHTASSGALSDALAVLEGRAQKTDPVDLPVRVAQHGAELIIDLGRVAGDAVRITPAGWELLDRSPVLFRRTKLTAPLPTPERGGTIEDLRRHVNIAEADWPLCVAWLVSAIMPDLPCPALLESGEQGTAKTTTARRFVALTDPSTAAVRPAPTDPGEWAVTASASRVVALDNLSGIAYWLSDALCRAVTGGGFVKRELYSDADLVVLEIRRAIILTAIDAGSLRGDLADRLVAVELERIPQSRRRDEAALTAQFDAELPRLVGALYTLTAQVLDALADVHVPRLPRMADYARVLAAVDQVLGTDGLDTFLTAGQRLAADVVDGDPVASAVRDFITTERYWSGAPGDLYKRVTPDHPGKDWPKAANAFSGRLKRCAPALREIGIEVEQDRDKTARTVRLWTHENGDDHPAATVTTTVTTVTTTPDDGPDDAGDDPMTVATVTPDANNDGLF
jgi:hypothetical protein